MRAQLHGRRKTRIALLALTIVAAFAAAPASAAPASSSGGFQMPAHAAERFRRHAAADVVTGPVPGRGRGPVSGRPHGGGPCFSSEPGQAGDRRRQPDHAHALPLGRWPPELRLAGIRLLGRRQLRPSRWRPAAEPARLTLVHALGRRGPGAWITVYTNPRHAFAVIAGLRFDTSGPGESGPRWRTDGRVVGAFKARHVPGLPSH